MSGIRAATLLAVWGAAHRSGVAGADQVLGQLASAGRTAGVRAADAGTAQRIDIPGPGQAGAGTIALLELTRRGGLPQLVLPVPGDLRGLPPQSPCLVAALDAAAAVLLPDLQIAVVPGEGHWRVFGAPGLVDLVPKASGGPSLFEAEVELDRAIRDATARLTRLDVARESAEVRAKVAAAMRDGAVDLPSGSGRGHRHGSAMLAKVVSLEALLQVAGSHETAAVSRFELASVDDALRPLAHAVRMGRLAAVTELVAEISRPIHLATPQTSRFSWSTERDGVGGYE